MDYRWYSRSSFVTLMIFTMATVVSGCGPTEFSAVSGFVSSVNYPNEYSPGTNCIYSIKSSVSGSVFIGFIDIDTEACCDKIEIWCSTSVINKRSFSGRNVSLSSFTLQSCIEAKVSFETDDTIAGRGFKLLFYWLSSVCGRTEFSELNGFVSSSNYPSPYAHSTNCLYSIRSPGIHRSLFIGFADLDTEACCDKVEIWCSTSVSNKRSFSGQNVNLSALTLQSCSEAKVYFRTDHSGTGRGFKLLFYWFTSSKGCGQTEFTELSGFISSNNYPGQYSSNTNCTYSIRSPGFHRILFLEFSDIDTEATLDRVEICCSTSVSNKRSFSGQNVILSAFTLQSCTEAKVSFRTDGSVTGRGFKLFFYWFTSENIKLIAPTTLATTRRSTALATTESATTTTVLDDSMHDSADNILTALGPKKSAVLMVVFASLFGFTVLVILFLIIYFIRRRKRGNIDSKPVLEVCGAVETRDRSNEGYSLDPLASVARPVSDVEEPDYEQFDPPDDDDADEYANIDEIKH